MKKILLLGAFLLVTPSLSFGTSLLPIPTAAATSVCLGNQTSCQSDDKRCSGSVTLTLNPNQTVTFTAQDSILSNEVSASQVTCGIAIDDLTPRVGVLTSFTTTAVGNTSGSGVYSAPTPGTYTFTITHTISKQGNGWSASGSNYTPGSFTVAQPASIQLNARAVQALNVFKNIFIKITTPAFAGE
jgi:hypothetical protein